MVKDTEIRLVTDASGNPTCQIYASAAWQTAITSSTALATNTWSHVSCAYDKANIKVYVNGVQTGSGAQTNAVNDAATNLLVGQDDGGTYANFIGTTDNLMVYNYAQTSKQIVSDMNAGSVLSSSGSTGGSSRPGSAVGHWKFDEGFGITANNSGNGGSVLNGTLTSMASPATATSGWTNSGKFGKALIFDGSNDNVSLTDTTALRPSVLTISAWVYTSSTSQTGCIVCKQVGSSYNDSYALFTNGGKMTMLVQTSGGTSVESVDPNNVPSNTWTHYVGVYDGTSTYLYKNGTLLDSDSGGITIGYDSNPTLIGADSNNSTPGADGVFWNGSIDEVKIYNSALTADEVKLDMNRGQAQVLGSLSDSSTLSNQAAGQEYCIPGDSTSCAAPVGRWDFEEGTGNSVNDKSGNANTGTWNGTLGNQWKPGKIGSGGNFNGSNNYVDTNFTQNLESCRTQDEHEIIGDSHAKRA